MNGGLAGLQLFLFPQNSPFCNYPSFLLPELKFVGSKKKSAAGLKKDFFVKIRAFFCSSGCSLA